MAQTYLIKSSPTAGNRNKGTVSVWVKRSSLGSTQNIYTDFYSTDNFGGIRFNSGDNLGVFSYAGASAQLDINTTRVFKDVNSWYHIVVAWDTTDGTSTDRIKIYINGERETSFTGSPTYPSSSQDLIFGIGGSYPIVIGRRGTDNNEYFDGSMSHFHRVDNQALAPTVFGSTDSVTGEWNINTSPSITYTGSSDYNFFILKDGNSLTDQSGQSNDLTLGYGTLTKTEDCPSNVFCTGNPLARYGGNVNYTNGNNFITGGGNNWTMGSATMGASSGKWYYELKILSAGTGSGYFKMGFQSADQSYANSGHSAQSELDASYAFYCQNGNLEVRTDGAVISGYDISTLGVSFSMNDIMCLAIDMDNKKAYFRKNADAWIKSADPVNGTNGLDISSEYPAGKGMIPNFAIYYPGTAALNFGNGAFGSTQLTGTTYQATGLGIFKYQPPTGYTALCTKGLNL